MAAAKTNSVQKDNTKSLDYHIKNVILKAMKYGTFIPDWQAPITAYLR